MSFSRGSRLVARKMLVAAARASSAEWKTPKWLSPSPRLLKRVPRARVISCSLTWSRRAMAPAICSRWFSHSRVLPATSVIKYASVGWESSGNWWAITEFSIGGGGGLAPYRTPANFNFIVEYVRPSSGCRSRGYPQSYDPLAHPDFSLGCRYDDRNCSSARIWGASTARVERRHGAFSDQLAVGAYGRWVWRTIRREHQDREHLRADRQYSSEWLSFGNTRSSRQTKRAFPTKP